MPFPAQILLVALGGAVAGGLVNLAIYSLGYYEAKPISPWSPGNALRRTWLDCLPIVGWLLLRRESNRWGRGFWVRPLLIELAFAAGLAWLYQAEMRGDLLPNNPQLDIPISVLWGQFVSHALLILLMTVATFIDFDEKTIPDMITIPGTLLGLVLVALWQGGTLPQVDAAGALQPLWLTTLAAWWPAWLDQWPGLLLGVGCLAAWCYALIPKLTTLRRGWWKGWVYLHASTFRTPAWWQMGLLAIVGSLGIVAIWLLNPASDQWRALLTSLVGMAFGGALVWGVRIVGYLGLRKEAMGFGDVILMAMIGAFLGWQSTIFVFFLAPLAAVVIALVQFLITGRRDIAFGPYLCAGTLLLILNFQFLWENWGAQTFGMGWFVPALIGGGLLFMFGLLWTIRLLEEAFFALRGPRK
jgi:prepilin signal peptidase PulO-like enzyme (type II secretory pathway)